MTFNPPIQAAQNGFPGNLEAVNHANQVNQLVATPSTQVIYPGIEILASDPAGNGQHFFVTSGPPNTVDHSQPFVMPLGKTSIGRVTVPLICTGNGSDLQITLAPDLAGSPDLTNPIASTVMTAENITALTIQGSLTTNVPPLVTAPYQAVSLQNNFSFAWSQPAIGPGGAAQFATPTTSGDYMILSGGYTGSAAAGTVATIQTLGGGFIGNPLLQPSIPQPAWYHMMCATTDSIMVCGGTNGISYYTTTWTASWDANTGTIGAWTAQANLPVPVVQGCAASWGDFVYVIGGNADATPASCYNTVYFANAQNGQIQSWSTVNPIPANLQLMFAAAINGWLVVAGGQNSASAARPKTYYAKINSDGTLGTWNMGPDMPVATYALGAQWSFSYTEDALLVFSGLTGISTYSTQCQTLPVGVNGLGDWWSQLTSSGGGGVGAFQVAAFPHGEAGNWQMNILTNTNYYGADTLVIPMLSVPLPATGLTPGNTYHVVIHNMNQDLTDYIQLYAGLDVNLTLPYMFRSRYSNGAWTAEPNSRALFISLYDNTPGGDLPIHLWQDPNSNAGNCAASSSTYVYDYQGGLLGYCESITTPQDPLNQNTLTTASVSPWTAVNGTITATAAQTHGGYADSGLLTPNGSSATVYTQSEYISVTAGTAYTLSSWLYMTTTWSNVSLSVNWFDSTHTYISTSSNIKTIGSATWTYFTNAFVAPAGTAYAALVPTLGGTPSAGNPLYLSYVKFVATDPNYMSSVAEMVYNTGQRSPTGVTQLN